MNLYICEDRRRVLDAAGHVLVVGGAGSGKTTIALLKGEHRVDGGLFPGQSVLFLSFSRAAVGRIMQTAKENVRREARTHLTVQTFHSFFWEVLRGHGYLLGAPRNLRILPPHDESAACGGEDADSPAWKAERERLFQEEGRAAFDLFAPKVHQLFLRSNHIRRLFADRHPLIIVDEAQDTAEDQWESLKLLAESSQLVCLADLEQQIYDFRPGVSSERVTQIMKALHPLRVDLKGQNHRSPGSEILSFGNDVLFNIPRGGPYRGVSQQKYSPRSTCRNDAIRQSIGIVCSRAAQSMGRAPESVAIMATWGRGVTIISRALTGNGTTKHIHHRVIIDEAPILLSSRLVAFLMEPAEDLLSALGVSLQLAADAFKAKRGKVNLDQAKRLAEQEIQTVQGSLPKGNSVGGRLLLVLRDLQHHRFSGEPRVDWLYVRHQLSESGCGPLKTLGGHAEQLSVFQRGQRIAEELAELWQTQSNYAGARRALDNTLAQEMLLLGANDLQGIHVMTIHKSKGKEFDAVIILDDGHNSPLVFCREEAPFPRSRKLLRVGITRAKHCVLMLTPAFGESPLLSGHHL
jgi:DNA helicase II / ATP-dependent DNA helicase PcrA